MDRRVKNFLKNIEKSFIDYRMLVTQLEAHVESNFCLGNHQNPVVNRLHDLKNKDVLWVIKEYSQFSSEAIHMLLDARIKTYEWTSLSEEIDRNMEEEKGSKTKGRPHLEMMRDGYKLELGFDPNSYRPSYVTEVFLKKMRGIFRNDVRPYVAGAILALESTSIPEFQALDTLVKRYLVDWMRSPSGDTQEYIDGHKFFEVGHKNGLMGAIEPYIRAPQADDFARGYLDVCLLMSDWWESLNQGINDYRLMKFMLGVLL